MPFVILKIKVCLFVQKKFGFDLNICFLIESQVLMRALRDFNIPKIVTDDLPIFMGLIGDLFPALDVPRKRDLDFEKQIKDAVMALFLQPEDGFVLKVSGYFKGDGLGV